MSETLRQERRRERDIPSQREKCDDGVDAGRYAHGYPPSLVNVAVVDILPCLSRQDNYTE